MSAGMLLSGGPRDFTASESPFSHLMRTLTGPLIRLETKACLMEWGWPGRKGLKPDRAHLDRQPAVAVWAEKGTLPTKLFLRTRSAAVNARCLAVYLALWGGWFVHPPP